MHRPPLSAHPRAPHGEASPWLRIVIPLFVALASLATSTLALAQATVVSGIVVGSASNPIPAAQVNVAGTQLGTTTDANGRFRISGVSGESVTLEVRRIGYRPSRQTVRPGAADIRIQLAEQSVALDEVVVTGTAGGQAKRELGNAVTVVNAGQVAEAGMTNSVAQMLNARAPGVFINPSSGNVGTGNRIRIRGAASLSLSNEPLVLPVRPVM